MAPIGRATLAIADATVRLTYHPEALAASAGMWCCALVASFVVAMGFRRARFRQAMASGLSVHAPGRIMVKVYHTDTGCQCSEG